MSNFYGLIGEKLEHSFSPRIHSEIFKKLNMDNPYCLFEIKNEELLQGLKGLQVLGCKGANVTVPYKIEIIKYLDNISMEAKNIGAVNTLVFNNGGITGHNTDYLGFGYALKKAAIKVKGKKAVILGTGGVAKAVATYLLDNEIGDITFVSRDLDKSKMRENRIISYKELLYISGDIIINCTPLGMYPLIDETPAKDSVLAKFSAAVDLIYNPRETLFLKTAREVGLVTSNGLYMLVAQAVAAQEIWQGKVFHIDFVNELYKNIKKF